MWVTCSGGLQIFRCIGVGYSCPVVLHGKVINNQSFINSQGHGFQMQQWSFKQVILALVFDTLVYWLTLLQCWSLVWITLCHRNWDEKTVTQANIWWDAKRWLAYLMILLLLNSKVILLCSLWNRNSRLFSFLHIQYSADQMPTKQFVIVSIFASQEAKFMHRIATMHVSRHEWIKKEEITSGSI